MINVCAIDIHGCVDHSLQISDRELVEKFMEEFNGKEIGVEEKIYYKGQIRNMSLYGDPILLYDNEQIREYLMYVDVFLNDYNFHLKVVKLLGMLFDSLRAYRIIVYRE